MPKLPVLSGKEIMKALSKAGFEVSRQRGSHVVMTKVAGEGKLVAVVPMHKEVDPGTLLAILAQANLTREQFLELI